MYAAYAFIPEYAQNSFLLEEWGSGESILMKVTLAMTKILP